MRTIVDCLMEHADDLLAGKGATEERIRQAESEIGNVFADDFRSCLQAFGTFAYDGHEFTGMSASSHLSVTDMTIKERASNPEIPANWYVIEEANIDGIVVWQSPEGSIHLSRNKEKPVKVADSLHEFLNLGSM